MQWVYVTIDRPSIFTKTSPYKLPSLLTTLPGTICLIWISGKPATPIIVKPNLAWRSFGDGTQPFLDHNTEVAAVVSSLSPDTDHNTEVAAVVSSLSPDTDHNTEVAAAVSSLSPDIDHDTEVAAVVSSLGPDTDCSSCVCTCVCVYMCVCVYTCECESVSGEYQLC